MRELEHCYPLYMEKFERKKGIFDLGYNHEHATYITEIKEERGR